jgi:photosystem II stability/assembly factor-like uncharacterized protein
MDTYIRLRALTLVSTAVALTLLLPHVVQSQEAAAPLFPEMQWRMIGPFRGGRVLPALGVPGRPNEYFIGAVGGGVWKTTNGGNTWVPIFDSQPIASIGAIAIAPSDPQIIYVGSGEADMRSDISFGDGMYKSTDAGATWHNIGLRDSRQIGRILVDPRDANLLLVAALGHAYGPNAERGVFRSTDAGATWTKVLGKNDDTGAIDLCFDPANSHIVYASLWQARRPPWSVYAPTSGPGSGLYKSTDEGLTWQQISGHGFPSEGLGRIGIAVAAGQNGNRVFALVDAKEGGVYRSDDAGRNWKRVSGDRRIWQRGWYFGGVTADPRDPNIVYVANTALYRSTDGGENFEAIKASPGGDDYHYLWIAPDDPQRMIVGSDQGAVISVDAGKTWSSWFNQPTAQFYRVTTDNRFPYRVYGSQQDSGTVATTSRSDFGQITFRDWSPIGSDESGYIALSSAEPDIVYGGGPFGMVFRFDWATGQSLDVAPSTRGGSSPAFRFTWTSPLVFSPLDPHLLYFGAQFVLRTDNAGHSWKIISPDLTKRAAASSDSSSNASKEKQEDRGVVYTIAPSPLSAGQIWAGTDNGLIQLTTDEGATWTNVTPPDIAAWSKITLIEASHFDASSAYAAVDCHELDDLRPYIYRTRDYGKTWQKITEGISERAYVQVVREDPVRKGLLFAGTETGVYFSLDDGDHWNPLQMNLPVASVRDLAIHGDDLIAATHGRSFWILDDIAPLREWADSLAARDVYLFHPARAIRIRRSENRDTPLPRETPAGANPPAGAILDYSLKSDVAGEVALEIRDKNGKLVRRYSSEDKPPVIPEKPEIEKSWLPKFIPLPKTAGTHRFVWDLRYAPPSAIHHEYSMAAPIASGTTTEPEGPLALPGEYEVRLIVSGQTTTAKLTLEQDPRVHVPAEDLAKQFVLQQKINAALTQATETIHAIAAVRSQLQLLKNRLSDASRSKEILAAADRIDGAAENIAGKETEWPLMPSGLAAVDGSLTSLAISVGGADSAPTDQAQASFENLQKDLNERLAKWDALKQQELSALNKQLKAAGIAPVAAESSSGAVHK